MRAWGSIAVNSCIAAVNSCTTVHKLRAQASHHKLRGREGTTSEQDRGEVRGNYIECACALAASCPPVCPHC